MLYVVKPGNCNVAIRFECVAAAQTDRVSLSRRAVLLGFGLLLLIVTIYTVNLVLSFPERTSGHAHKDSIR